MTFIDSINNFIGLFANTFRFFKKGRAWALLLIIFAVNWLILFAHYKFYSPIFYWVISPWLSINSQYAQGFTHYPGHFLLMPYYFGWAKMIVGIFIEGVILGGVATIFYKDSEQKNTQSRSSVSAKISFWFQLSLTWVIFNGLMVLINMYVPELFSELLYSPKRQMLFNYLFIPGLYILLMGLLFYSIPYAAIYRVNAFNAVFNSIMMFIRNPISTIFLSAVILFVPIILSIIMNSPDVIVEKFKPYLVYWIQFTGLVTDVLVNFFWIGTAVTFIKIKE